MSPKLWTVAEEKVLVDFLHENRSEAGDGGNFKKTTFQRAAEHLGPLAVNGHTKDVKGCQNKWAAVSLPTDLYCFCTVTDNGCPSSEKSSRLSWLFDPSLDGIGMMRLVQVSLPTQRLHGMTMSRSIPTQSRSATVAGRTSTNSSTSCHQLLLEPMFTILPLLNHLHLHQHHHQRQHLHPPPHHLNPIPYLKMRTHRYGRYATNALADY